MPDRTKTSMRDVAEAANVSATTVWMVIHNKPGVAPETVERVLSTINELNYNVKSVPNGQKHAASVGLLIEHSTIPAISDVFYGDIILGFQAEAARLGYHVVLSMFDRSSQIVDHIKAGFVQKVSGFVVANDGDITPETLMQLTNPDMPIVLVESYLNDHEFPCVLGDNFMAGYNVTRHMLNLGHERIAVLKGPVKYSSLVDRWRGCLAALAEQGILTPPQWMPEPISGHPLKGYLQMKDVLDSDEIPAAVIAISDKTALGAMEAIREAGLLIPNDIAVASIDNTLESAYARPPLTTVHIPKYEIGVLALRKLHQMIEGEESIPIKSVVYSKLIVRESSGS
jgi:DNA-binding LacI/PurR family transcriptional regulator